MSKINLKSQLAEIPMSAFKFRTFEKRVSSPDDDGKKITYLIFELDEPLEKVVGSIMVYDPDTDQGVHRNVIDVTEVRCNVDLMYADEEKDEKEQEFHFDVDAKGALTKSGYYKGDLLLEVSSKDEVWLTDVPYTKFRQEMNAKDRKASFSRYRRGR
jgi:hypothetical protein